jgi:hypothetical protein
MFALCGNRTRDLLRSRRVFPPLRQIGRQISSNYKLFLYGCYACGPNPRGQIIDLVLIDPQSVGKRTHDLMDTVNAKKRWKTTYWHVNKYLKLSHLLALVKNEAEKKEASF